jgi:branched-chain amino acid transport system substrate-binding protein
MKGVLLLISLTLFQIIAQTDEQSYPDINAEFLIATTLYDSSQYNDALETFNRIANQYEYSDKTTASTLFIGKILLNQKKYELGEQHLIRFIRQFGNSKFIDEAKFTLAVSYIEQQKFEEAVTVLLEILNNSKSDNYISKSKLLVETIFFEKLDINKLKTTLAENQNIKVRPVLLLILGKLYKYFNENLKANENFKIIIDNYKSAPEYASAKNLYNENITESEKLIPDKSQKTILVLLSLTSEYADVRTTSRDALEGIKYAFDEFNRGNYEKIGLLIKDIKGDENIIQSLAEEVKDIEFVGIFAPMHTNDVELTLKYFDSRNIPILSPTATGDSLTIKSKNFYQANPSFVMRGKVMAQFISFVENKKNIAVIHSKDGYSVNLADSFIEEFKKNGGVITEIAKYPSKSSNLNQVVAALKKNKFDGIYAPISETATANLLLSSLLRNSINVPIYGNQDWMNVKGLDNFSQLSKRLTITSDYFVDYRDHAYISFSKKYYEITKKEVNRNVIYGYDAASFLLGIFGNGVVGNKNYSALMKSDKTHVGFHNSLIFDNSRINGSLNVIRYRNNIFELVDIFRYESK